MMPKLTVQEQPIEMNTVYFIYSKMELSCILHVLTNGIQIKENCEIISESNMTTTIIQFKWWRKNIFYLDARSLMDLE